MIYSDSDIRTLKGIGDKKAQAFNRLGVFTVYDLIHFILVNMRTGALSGTYPI